MHKPNTENELKCRHTKFKSCLYNIYYNFMADAYNNAVFCAYLSFFLIICHYFVWGPLCLYCHLALFGLNKVPPGVLCVSAAPFHLSLDPRSRTERPSRSEGKNGGCLVSHLITWAPPVARAWPPPGANFRLDWLCFLNLLSL